MKSKMVIIAGLLCLGSCSKDKKDVTHTADYKPYLNARRLASDNAVYSEIGFWNDRFTRNGNDEASLMKLAAIHAGLFKTTGLIEHIYTSDSLYQIVLTHYPQGNVDVFHGLAANAISQHRFQDAKRYAERALSLKDKKATSLLLVVDALLEVGNYADAKKILRQFKNKNSFGYLIRKAKLQDHEGMLDSAIISMEKASQRVKGSKHLSQWAQSNLGDMYGHAGRIQESYDAYLDVLKKNPNDNYALQRIAWIALSYDQKFNDAKEIISALSGRRPVPELYLWLAEIAEMENNQTEKLNQLKKFKSFVERRGYKKMYHKYLALLEAEEFGDTEAAVNIARMEIEERPCPQSYDLLAWSYFQQEKYGKALHITTHKVEGRTFEPEVLFHLAMIFKANGNNEKARGYFTKALESEFELGPSKAKRIRSALMSMRQ